MNRILIITKNVFVEKPLQEQLQKLDYDVLVSAGIWEKWLQFGYVDPFVESFQWVFLSETISDEEANAFGKGFISDCLVRLTDSYSVEERRTKGPTGPFYNWLALPTSLEDLRNNLITFFSSPTIVVKKTDVDTEELQLSGEGRALPNSLKTPFPIYYTDIHFTKMEKMILHQLVISGNKRLTREELSSSWHSKNKNSKLSQLSSTITSIRKKVKQVYTIDKAIFTYWGEGYQLNTHFYRCLLQGEFSQENEIENVAVRGK
jgi:Response regulators consisting of a CheY-like receiver domain and a winged-helix DNA-binding domain